MSAGAVNQPRQQCRLILGLMPTVPSGAVSFQQFLYFRKLLPRHDALVLSQRNDPFFRRILLIFVLGGRGFRIADQSVSAVRLFRIHAHLAPQVPEILICLAVRSTVYRIRQNVFDRICFILLSSFRQNPMAQKILYNPHQRLLLQIFLKNKTDNFYLFLIRHQAK